VTDHQFLFALKVSDHPGCDTLLGDLAECVLTQAGYAPPAIADILSKVREALDQVGIGGRREGNVQFRAEAGQLIIVVSDAGGGREWRVARALPD
jgi:hypothetical protein